MKKLICLFLALPFLASAQVWNTAGWRSAFTDVAPSAAASEAGPYTLSVSNSAVYNSATLVTTLGVTVAGVPAGGSVLLAVKHEGAAATTLSVSDGTSSLTGGTYLHHANNDLHSQVFRLPVSVASGSVTYTLTASSGIKFISLRAVVYTHSGSGTPVFDVENGATGTGTTQNSGNITTTGANDVTFAWYGSYSSAIPGSEQIGGVTRVNQYGPDALKCEGWDRFLTSPSTVAATMILGSSQAWTLHVVSLK